MFGWINFIVRDMLIKKHDHCVWEEVCECVSIPACTSFPRHQQYSHASTMTLVTAAAEVLDVELSELLDALGEYFVVFVREDGHDELLMCLGDTLQEWLSNINYLHLHLELVLGTVAETDKESEQKYNAPLFWVTDDRTETTMSAMENADVIMLYYQSVNGAALAPMVVGFIREVARAYFSTAIVFEQVMTQGVNGSKFTSWKVRGDKPLVSIIPPSGRYFTAHAVSSASGHLQTLCSATHPISQPLPTVPECHYEGRSSSDLYDEDTIENSYDENSDDEYFNVEGGNRLPFSNAPLAALQRSSSAPSMYSSPLSSAPLPTLSNRQMKEMFPFCIVFNQKMIVVDCGHSLLEIVGSSPIGSCLNDILEVKQPAGDVDTWSNFLQLYSVANDFSSEIKCSDETVLKLKGIISLSDDCQMAFYMCHADVRTFHEMKQANLQPRHLATQACRIEYLMQMEQLQSEKRASMKLKKVQKELDKQTSLAAKLRTDATIQASKLATQCLENKRTFVRYIGHEIRTPLTVVKLGLKLALADARELNANEDFISNISDCEDSVDVAVAILNDLLAYEKLDSGILEMFKEIIVVVPFVLRSLRPFETQAAEKNIKLTIENNCSGDMDTLAIYADKSKMCQVIRNFLSNAIKFTPGNGHVTVRISVVSPTKERRRALSDTTSRSASSILKQMQQHQQPKALSPNKRAQLTSSPANLGSSPNLKERRFMKCTSADSLLSMSSARPAAYKTIKSVFDNEEFQLLENVLVVEFIDSGPGISEENQKKLFRENVQFNPHVTQEGGGSGLGLWISNGIVKLHNGYVDVKSNPDDSPGVTFSLQMPIYRKTSLRVSPGKKCSLKSASAGDERSFINEPKFSFSDSDDDDLTADDVIITTSTLSDLHMDINDSLDEKMFLHALVSDKEKRLARQHSLPTPSLKLETSDDISPEVKVLKQSQHKGGQRRGAVELGPLYGCRVLLVDDSKLILRVTAATLKSLGVECDAVLDGEKALEKIKSCCWRSGEPSSNSEVENVVELDSSQWSLESRQRTTRTRSGSLGETCTQSSSWDINYYDLVMLDKQMPVMDGLKTCENLRSMGYKGIIVGVTGSCMPSEVEEFRNVGINEVFAKPLDISQLENYYAKIRSEKSRKFSH